METPEFGKIYTRTTVYYDRDHVLRTKDDQVIFRKDLKLDIYHVQVLTSYPFENSDMKPIEIGWSEIRTSSFPLMTAQNSDKHSVEFVIYKLLP